MRAVIYTRKGDKGETGFLDGKRVPKNDVRVEAVGAVDELNTCIGLAVAQIRGDPGYKMRDRKGKGGSWREEIIGDLERTQRDLLAIGSLVAGYDPSEKRRAEMKKHLEGRVTEIEEDIDKKEAVLPQLRNFILPGGSLAGAKLHVARTICRRAERRVVAAAAGVGKLGEEIKYLNRLSDYLFTLARWVNFQSGDAEQVWKSYER